LSLVHHPGQSNIKPTIHRDLKPDNIIRRASDNKLVLIDFGAVKQIRRPNPNNPNTQISMSIGIGTPGYTPVEQGSGAVARAYGRCERQSNSLRLALTVLGRISVLN
jgi:serine/threonine protein kinase